jgi:HAD superfamily hydrolase (TIGR01509 family)
MAMNFLGKQIDAVIFDMDGLMLDTESLNRATWKRTMLEQGYDYPDEFYARVCGQTIPETERLFKQAYGEGFPFYEMRAIKQGYLEAHVAEHGVVVKSGLRELLDTLERYGVKKGIASTTKRHTLLSRLSSVGLLERFSALASGDEVSDGKPKTELYLRAAGRLEAAPGACLALEDSEPGCAAARQAGMLAVMIPDLYPPSEGILPALSGCFASLSELRQALENGNRKAG